MKKFFMSMGFALMAGLTGSANAGYDSNAAFKITDVSVYTDGDFIYVQVETPLASHPKCITRFMVIPETVPENRRNMLYSRLMTAKVTKEMVNIGYDGTDNCVHGYVRIHRVG